MSAIPSADTAGYISARISRLNALYMRFNELDGVPQRQKLSPRDLSGLTNGQVACDRKLNCIHLGDCCRVIGPDFPHCKYRK